MAEKIEHLFSQPWPRKPNNLNRLAKGLGLAGAGSLRPYRKIPAYALVLYQAELQLIGPDTPAKYRRKAQQCRDRADELPNNHDRYISCKEALHDKGQGFEKLARHAEASVNGLRIMIESLNAELQKE